MQLSVKNAKQELPYLFISNGTLDAFRKFLHSKIHRATVTHADLHYEGSLTIPPKLMQAAKLLDYEAINIWNVTSGTRLETYAITGSDDVSICANGAAAHLVKPNDIIIIAAFTFVKTSSIYSHKASVVFVDENNQIKELRPETPGPLANNGNL